jgi:preprotein translocase subunit Sec61beta
LAAEDVLEGRVRRHVFASERPFAEIMDGIYGGISRPDIESLFRQLGASMSYEEFASLVRQAQGSAGLMRFLELELDRALALDPQAASSAGLGLVRLIAGNPVTMGEMTRHVPDAGSYAPVSILIQELPDGGTRLAYDSVARDIAIYDSPAATKVAENLDAEALTLLRQVSGLSPSPGALNSQAYAGMWRSLRVAADACAPEQASYACRVPRCA